MGFFATGLLVGNKWSMPLPYAGRGSKPLKSDLRGPILSQMVDDVKKDLDEQRQIWSTKGCTIMTDGWTDRRNRTLLNFLVSSVGD